MCLLLPRHLQIYYSDSCQTIHYINRAIIGPLLAPSMSPIHILVWICACAFQVINGLSIGGWLAGHGPTTRADWSSAQDYKVAGRIELGMIIFFLGLLGNIYHDDELREIRRAALRKQKDATAAAPAPAKDASTTTSAHDTRVYQIPENGLFRWIFYPHYLLEWVEWLGFWIIGGVACLPARTFLLNEVATMLPRAIQGRQWYIRRFGREKVAGRKAIIPGIL